MARIATVTTQTAISSTTFGNALQADYVSQTDANAQTITGPLNVTGAITTSSDTNIQTNAVQRTVSSGTLPAAATTFATVGEAIIVTGDVGGNNVTTITDGVVGQILIITFTDALVTIVNDDTHAANTIDLQGGANLVSADDTTLMLFFDGTSWYELSRSVN